MFHIISFKVFTLCLKHVKLAVSSHSIIALFCVADRMPVILGNKSAMDAWLYGCPSFKVESVLKSYEDPDLVKSL